MEDVLKVQINDYDSYQSEPTRLDQDYDTCLQVPIIRIYGAIGFGKGSYNVLVHVHNTYPYLYIDCFDGDLIGNNRDFIDKKIEYLETLLQESFQHRKGAPDDDGYDSDKQDVGTKTIHKTRRKYIANISVCRGTPIYGYHLGYQLVYKVSLLSPSYKARLFRLLNENKVALNTFKRDKKRIANVYEAHLPYTLQFLTDFNLYGCGWLEVGNCYFRSPILNNPNNANSTDLVTHLQSYIKSNNILSSSFVKRIGKSTLEIDIRANEISNRKHLQERHLHNDFNELSNYKSNKVAKQMYLSSLVHTFEDLKFQCEIRNSEMSFTQDILKGFLGIGQTNWPNQLELNDLLSYVSRINKKFTTNFKLKRDTNTRFPTIFESIDVECKEEKQHRLNFVSDLIQWQSYSQLFNSKSRKSHKISSTSNLSRFSQSNKIHYDDKLYKSDNHNISDIEDENLNDVIEENLDDKLEEMKNTEVKELLDDITELHDTSIRLDDRIMLSLTQNRKRKRSYSNFTSNVSSSLQIPSSFNQIDVKYSISDFNLASRVFTGHNVFDIVIPHEISKNEILNSFDSLGIVKINYNDPFFSNSDDVPKFPLIFSNRKIVIPCMNSESIVELPFSKKMRESLPEVKSVDWVSNKNSWLYIKEPPSKTDISNWVQFEECRSIRKSMKFRSQIELPTTKSNDYKCSLNTTKKEKRPDNFKNLSNFCMEVHCNTIGDSLPNPVRDSISAIFYNFDNTNDMSFENHSISGVLLLDMDNHYDESKSNIAALLPHGSSILLFKDEKSIVDGLIELINHFDPDIFSGYEINSSSWGYIIERFRLIYDINLLPLFSRCISKNNGKFGDRWGYTHTSVIEITGRHCLNVWRALRSEISLTDYTLENMSYHILHQELPRYSNHQLTLWLRSSLIQEVFYFFNHYFRRISVIQQIIDIREIISKNVEHSRLIGIDFNSNFYRGSQFKVESILSRISKSENLLLNSPSKQQVHQMKPLECIPLIMEPDSNFYNSPLVVLDFQSLYPSIIIAYNYCFSTLLGRLHNFRETKNTVGYLKNLTLDPGLIDFLKENDSLNFSPNGLMFVKSSVRKSILAKMLEDILNMRFQIKSVMNSFKDDVEFNKIYNSRQLALKLIANVTYGYTSATFSGRMPNSDLADAIVATGREILTKSVELIEGGEYGAKVVYGDTDSLFVYFPGKSKKDAFQLGRQIADFITGQFPDPICLKFEKVYHPCVLLSKKRYVGQCYTYENQSIAKFDAKGIETIRRDGIPAQQKIVEKTLRILFESQDLSKVKEYVVKEFHKIMLDKISVSDFCFAKEVRYGTYKTESHLPPGAIVSRRKIEKDPRAEPQYRERVPYVVIFDRSKQRVKDRCVSPEEYIQSYSTSHPLSLDYEYYITRVLIPPLERIFNLMGVDIKLWYQNIPKIQKEILSDSNILNYSNLIEKNSCLYCGTELASFDNERSFCTKCSLKKDEILTNVTFTLKSKEAKVLKTTELCNSCVSKNMIPLGSRGMLISAARNCQNLSCVIYYDKFKAVSTYEHLKDSNKTLLDTLSW